MNTEVVEAEELVLRIPETALIPEGATFYEGEDDGRCRLVRPDGTRCGATRRKAYGLCGAHAGLTAIARSPQEQSARGNAERARRASARAVLGISSRTAAQPLQAARLRAQLRADEIARGIVDDVLDAEMKPAERQRALLAAVETLYPQMTAQLSVELPEDEEGARQLGWEQLRQLAAAHLDGGTPAVPPALEGA